MSPRAPAANLTSSVATFQTGLRLRRQLPGIRTAKALYYIPQVVTGALIARSNNRVRDISREPTTSDHDIERRRWFMLDVGPVRPADISSSDSEHIAALERLHAICEALSAQGWPEPMKFDSANGGHAMWRVDLAADDGGLIKSCLAALAFQFNDANITIDQTVFNPSRIWKLPGTWSRKGDNVPDRPHRMARILQAPDVLTCVPHELLERLGAYAPRAETAWQPRSGSRPTLEPLNLENWIHQHNLDVIGPHEWQGGKRWIFSVCPWDSDHRNRSAYIIQFPSGAIAAGCHHNGCASRDWHSLRDLVEPGWREVIGRSTP